MQKYRSTIALLLLLSLIIFSAKANTPQSILENVASNNPDSIASATEKMVVSGNPDFYPILNSELESSIYIFPELKENYGLVTAIPSGEDNEGNSLFKLFKIYPEGTEVKDASGKSLIVPEEALMEVKISRRIRNIIQPISSTIQLYHWNLEKKKLAIKSLATVGTLKDIPTLENILKNTKDPLVQRVTKECIYQLTLQSPDKSKRIEAIKGLEINHGSDALNILIAHSKNETDPDAKAVLSETIETIEGRNGRIEIAQNLFTGLSLGSVLILMALGLAIIYGLMGIINMAHGEFMMIGAYTTFIVQGIFIEYMPQTLFSYYFWIAMPCSFVMAGLSGVLIEILIIRYLYNKPLESLLATWGVSLVLIQLARTIFGDLTAVKAPSFATGGFEIVPQLTLPFNRLFIIALTGLIIVAVNLILTKTSLGLKIRAVTQNRNMSACLGVPTAKINRYAFFLGTGIAGLAGWAITLVGNVVPNMGQTFIVDSFLVVVTGGVGKLLGTVFSGLGMGFITKIFEPIFQAVYGKVLILVLVILFLQVKPTGLFPAKGRNED